MVFRGHGVDVGDIDGDGDADIILAGNSNPIYINDGKANFTRADNILGDSASGAFNVLLHDFDSNGRRNGNLTDETFPDYIWISCTSNKRRDAGEKS